MDLTDVPDVRNTHEESPDFDEWEDPEALLKDRPTRERMLDVVLQLREPRTVAEIAQRAACDVETARDYLEWFAEMGIVRGYEGRPARYERNDSYLWWRRVEQIRSEFAEEEIVAELRNAMSEIETYRDRFDADDPEEVSLLEAAGHGDLEAEWEALSTWKTALRRAELLDAARRDESPVGTSRHVDA